MKLSRIYLLLFFISIFNLSNAQIFLGGRVGLNMSFLSIQPTLEKYDILSEISTKLNPNVALLGYFEIGPYFAIQPELVYNRKGAKSKVNVFRDNDTTITGEWNYSFDYVEVPLMFKLSLNSKGFDPFIEFGGYYGYMFKAKYHSEAFVNQTEILREDYNFEFTNDPYGRTFNKNDYGFKLGVGGTFKVSKGVAFFSIRYTQGLVDVVNYQTKPTDYKKTLNRVFQITLGYGFEIRKSTQNKIYYY